MCTFRFIAAAIAAVVLFGHAVSANGPTYAAKVPKKLLTPDVVETERLGTLNFFDGLPSEETVEKLWDNLDFMRGVDAFLHGIPATSVHGFCEGL